MCSSEGGQMANNKIFVAVAGNIGAGKTTLTRLLSKRFNWTPYFEVVQENPYLSDFYKDMSRWSFSLQVFFLNHRFRAHQEINQYSHSAIQDRSIYEDANIFARNLLEQGQMEERDYKNYLHLYNTMCQFITPPDLMIYLKKSLPKIKERIALRGRDYEKDIPEEYLRNLGRYYDDWMENYSLGKKLIINTDDLDILENPNDFNYIAQKILDNLDQRDLYLESKATIDLL